MSHSSRKKSEPSVRSIAEEFAIYAKLDGIDRWKFRRLLRWICRNPASVQLLLELEKKLVEKELFSWQIFEVLQTPLTWYNREVCDEHLENRLQPSRLPDMLQVLIVFLDASHKLDHQYRDLIVHIIDASDNLAEHGTVSPGMTPEQFRLEAVKAISGLHSQWEDWRPFLINRAESTLACLVNITHKVRDLHQFRIVYEDMAPTIGLEATCSLMAMSQDYQEFSRYFARVTAQLEYWRWKYQDMFRQIENASELDQILLFLETLARHPLLEECIRHAQTHGQAVRFFPSTEVRDACLNREWARTLDYDVIIDGLVEAFVQKVVLHELRMLWNGLDDGNIWWSFQNFTRYIPYGMRNDDWTIDDERTRRYWNWQEGKRREWSRFRAALLNRLCSLFRELDAEEFDIVLGLLPNYVRIEAFEQEVEVPTIWEKGIEYEEGYKKWTGFYEEEVEVARPRGYELYLFTFDRPNVQDAIDLLDDSDKLGEAIAAYRHSRGCGDV